jgi:type II secretory pathway pseudopilin PulG
VSARTRSRGYTAVELMMSLAVFSAGVTGIITMQRTAVGANRMARNVAVASSIAQAWQTQLAADATLWRENFDRTTWLKSLDNADLNGTWQLPDWSDDREFGARFDALGNPHETGADQFCVHLRLTWLYYNGIDVGTVGTGRNGTIRTEVRVFWPREGVERVAHDCDQTAVASGDEFADATDRYYFVVQTGAVRQP